jgi:hypothetical protein
MFARQVAASSGKQSTLAKDRNVYKEKSSSQPHPQPFKSLSQSNDNVALTSSLVAPLKKRSSYPNKTHRNINNRGPYTDQKATIA